jgi:hypothetical protein
MNLIRLNSVPNPVPSMDVDLFWHTHQLSSSNYLPWCMQHLRHPLNHEDTLPENELYTGLANTIAAWGSHSSKTTSSHHLSQLPKTPRLQFPNRLTAAPLSQAAQPPTPYPPRSSHSETSTSPANASTKPCPSNSCSFNFNCLPSNKQSSLALAPPSLTPAQAV